MVFAWSFAQPCEFPGGVNGNVIDGEHRRYLSDGILHARFSSVIPDGGAAAFFFHQDIDRANSAWISSSLSNMENRNQPSPSGGAGFHSSTAATSSIHRSKRASS